VERVVSSGDFRSGVECNLLNGESVDYLQYKMTRLLRGRREDINHVVEAAGGNLQIKINLLISKPAETLHIQLHPNLSSCPTQSS
jgi:hypothetical protein